MSNHLSDYTLVHIRGLTRVQGTAIGIPGVVKVGGAVATGLCTFE
jgi:hypothetical protein